MSFPLQVVHGLQEQHWLLRKQVCHDWIRRADSCCCLRQQELFSVKKSPIKIINFYPYCIDTGLFAGFKLLLGKLSHSYFEAWSCRIAHVRVVQGYQWLRKRRNKKECTTTHIIPHLYSRCGLAKNDRSAAVRTVNNLLLGPGWISFKAETEVWRFLPFPGWYINLTS